MIAIIERKFKLEETMKCEKNTLTSQSRRLTPKNRQFSPIKAKFLLSEKSSGSHMLPN